jgi:hypothetical protein
LTADGTRYDKPPRRKGSGPRGSIAPDSVKPSGLVGERAGVEVIGQHRAEAGQDDRRRDVEERERVRVAKRGIWKMQSWPSSELRHAGSEKKK